MSWMAEVIADGSGAWCGNALRFATPTEADVYAADLASRWTLVRDWRVVESADPVTYAYVDRRLVRVEEADHV
jgi:hypothetical protein